MAAPKLEATLTSVERHATWVARALAKGVITPSDARELTQSGRLMMAAIRQRNDEEFFERAEDTIRRLETAADRLKHAHAARGQNLEGGHWHFIPPTQPGQVETRTFSRDAPGTRENCSAPCFDRNAMNIPRPPLDPGPSMEKKK